MHHRSGGSAGGRCVLERRFRAAQQGGTLTFAIGTDPISVNPQGGGAGNDARYITRQIVDSLVDQDPETGEILP